MEISESRGEWFEIPQSELEKWDKRLQTTTASLYQFPLWNEPYKRLYFSPKYLCYKVGDREAAYVCILSAGFWRMWIGLVRFGPVSLIEDNVIFKVSIQKLEEWAKRKGYIFLRFSHSNIQILDMLKLSKRSKEIDSFPLYPEEPEALIVPFQGNAKATMNEFSETALREIKRAVSIGYEITRSDNPGSFDQVWFLNQLMVMRKQINSRPLVYYQDLVKLATRAGAGSLYTASLRDKIVQSIFVIRAAGTAYYSWGATDTETVGNYSPSRLLHWTAIEDSLNLGMKYYHLGAKAGPVYQFKKRFHPDEITMPPPVTLVINRFLFYFWSKSIMKFNHDLLVWIRKKIQTSRD